jgi:hypothetical protein
MGEYNDKRTGPYWICSMEDYGNELSFRSCLLVSFWFSLEYNDEGIKTWHGRGHRGELVEEGWSR